MALPVLLTKGAVQDLEDLYRHIGQHDGAGKAGHVLDRIAETFGAPSQNPRRGSYPNELLALGIREYREVYFKPYRIIYRVSEEKVYLMLIVDGRRDMQSLLRQRLLMS